MGNKENIWEALLQGLPLTEHYDDYDDCQKGGDWRSNKTLGLSEAVAHAMKLEAEGNKFTGVGSGKYDDGPNIRFDSPAGLCSWLTQIYRTGASKWQVRA